MPLLRELYLEGAEEVTTLRLRRRDGVEIAEIRVGRPVQGGQPVPIDLWVADTTDIVVDPPDPRVRFVWEDGLGTLRLLQLLRRVPPHGRLDYVRYPALIAKRLVAAGWARPVPPEEEAELNTPRLYIPHGRPHFGARGD